MDVGATRNTATPIIIGGPVFNEILGNSGQFRDIDVFSFDVIAGQQITFTVELDTPLETYSGENIILSVLPIAGLLLAYWDSNLYLMAILQVLK